MLDKSRFLFRIYGDSLTMPRGEADIFYFDTYWNILLEKCSKIWKPRHVGSYIRHNPGATVIDLYNQYCTDSVYFHDFPGDFLIIHCGISDCAPRPIPPALRRRISGLPVALRDLIVKILHKSRSRLLKLGLSWRVVKPETFRYIYRLFLEKAVNEVPFVCVINIAPTTLKNEKHSPGLSSSIELYNNIIKDIVESISSEHLFLLDVHSHILSQVNAGENLINKEDGHHLTKEGHAFFADLILSEVIPVFLKKGISDNPVSL